MGTVRPQVTIAVAVAFFVVVALLQALNKPVMVAFDELAHVSYLAEVQRCSCSASLATATTIDANTFQPTAYFNYLNHASPYYRLLALGPELTGRPENLVLHRLANIMMVLTAIALLLVAAGKVAPRSLTPFVISLCFIPVLSPLAAMVNNDNFAFLGAAILIVAIARQEWKHWVPAAAVGLVVASWAKLTGLLLCGSFLAAFLLLARVKLTRAQVLVLTAAFVIAAVPYVQLWLEYGSPAPHTAGQDAALRGGSLREGWANMPRLGMPVYASGFVVDLLKEWWPRAGDPQGHQIAMLAIPSATLILAAIGIWHSARSWVAGCPSPVECIVLAGAIGILVTFVIHLGFSYQRHLALGWMMDAYPRYYLPMIPTLILGAILATERLRAWVKTAASALLTVGPIAFLALG